MIKESDFKNTLFGLLDKKTYYWNNYPYNLGYIHTDKRISFDCVNLLKALLNGWHDTGVPGYFQKDLSKTGDCNEWGLISQCNNVSGDFTKLERLSVLYMGGHIGCYVGEFKRNGKTYNTIECTSNSWGDGVIPTWTASNGSRMKDKNSSSKIGTWEKHGSMEKWITYDNKPLYPFDYQKAIRLAMKIEKGDFGNNPKRKETIVTTYGQVYYDASQGIINYLHNNY